LVLFIIIINSIKEVRPLKKVKTIRCPVKRKKTVTIEKQRCMEARGCSKVCDYKKEV